MKKKTDKNGGRSESAFSGGGDVDRDLGDGSAPGISPDSIGRPDDSESEATRGSTATPSTAAGSELAAITAERDRLAEQLRRTIADLQNIRKRHTKELDDVRKRAIEELAMKLLPVLDNFHLALATLEQHDTGADRSDSHAMVEGLRMVRTLLESALAQHGLSEIPALGQPFDPNVHEAIGVDQAAAVAPGHVARVMQQGYALGDRVIRPARVFVAGERSGNLRPESSTGFESFGR